MNQGYGMAQVNLVTVKELKVAVLQHRGDPRLLAESIRAFIAWRRQNHLPPRVSDTFNILYGDPADAPPHEFRLDLCARTDREVDPNAFGVVGGSIPGGRCASLRIRGSDANLRSAFKFLYAEWLPQSGEALRDQPRYVQRVRFYPEVTESDAVTDVFLPLTNAGSRT